MNFDCRMQSYGSICAALAALALSLAACGDKPATETAATGSAASAAAPKAKQAAATDKAGATRASAAAADDKAAADTALAAKVKEAVLATPGLKSMAMDVRASGGAVTLFGTADGDAQRRQAEQVAAGVPGVKSVKNELLIVRGS